MKRVSGHNSDSLHSLQDSLGQVARHQSPSHCDPLSWLEVEDGRVLAEDRHLLPATEDRPGAHVEGEAPGGGGEGVEVTLVSPGLTHQPGRGAGEGLTVSVPGQESGHVI